MRNRLSANTSSLQRVFGKILLSSALAAGIPLFAQITVISADNLAPFEPRDVGTTSDAKTVRIKLNYARAISSIAVAPGNTEFTAGSVSGCVVNGHTINPALSACSVDVTFSPRYPGLRTAPLVMTDGAGIKSSVGLEGIGLAPRASLTPGIITTVFWGGAGELYQPEYLAFDQEGNYYIADSGDNRIRKVDHNGVITTVAGNGNSGYSGDGGPATSAMLNSPYAVAVDAAGNLYIADIFNGRVRKVDRNGIITTVAGNGSFDSSGDGGPATSAGMYSYSVAVDAAGNLYIAEASNNRVRKVDRNGIISTFAGNGTYYGPSGDGGPAKEATVDIPIDVAADAAGNLYIAESEAGRIRKVDTQGIITTIAGTGTAGFSGDDGPATQAELDPSGVAVDAAGNVYIAELFNARIRRVDTNGMIKRIAGYGIPGYSGDGGPATQASINPGSVAIDSSGGIYMVDGAYSLVRKVDVSKSAVDFASQNVSTVSPDQEVIVTNSGNQHIEFTGLSLTRDFGQLTGKARDCTDTTFLGAGFSCAIRITFAPTAAGTLKGSATLTDNSLNMPGTTQTISLSGTGTNP